MKMKLKINCATALLLSACFAGCTKGESTRPAATVKAEDNSTLKLINQVATTCTTSLADLEKLQFFPPANAWHEDVSGLPIDPYSTQILKSYATTGLHADFGSGLIDGEPFGFPFTVVCGTQPMVPIVYRANGTDGNFGDESDPGPFPIPLNAPIESGGDAHVIVVDKDHHLLYELYNANVKNGHWEASSGAIFKLNSNTYRPNGWTSADAAGLPILAGLVRYDEVVKGVINHAIRFTLQRPNTRPTHVFPARHEGNGTGALHAALPFGGRLRLKANYDISGFPPHVQTLLVAFKKYGIILADIGSNMFISGTQDERWDNDEMATIHRVKASDFEVVKFIP